MVLSLNKEGQIWQQKISLLYQDDYVQFCISAFNYIYSNIYVPMIQVYKQKSSIVIRNSIPAIPDKCEKWIVIEAKEILFYILSPVQYATPWYPQKDSCLYMNIEIADKTP